ncbi:hypothetical protein B0H14DRAFT_2902112, partial [Mycena olivaceomarginata]
MYLNPLRACSPASPSPHSPLSSSRARPCFMKASCNARRSSRTSRCGAARSSRFDGCVSTGSSLATATRQWIPPPLLLPRPRARCSQKRTARRLDRESRVYAALPALQSVAVPRVVGLYTGGAQDSSRALILRHAGAFDELDSDERCGAYVVTVTSRSKSNLSKAKSESGPTLLIDF